MHDFHIKRIALTISEIEPLVHFNLEVRHRLKGNFPLPFYNIPKIQIQYNICFILKSIFISSSKGRASFFGGFVVFPSAAVVDFDITIFVIL